MFNKNTDLNRWLWKWHVIAGLITMPFMLLLATTGVVYLFKDNINGQLYHSTLHVSTSANIDTKLNYNEQLLSAMQHSDNKISAMLVPSSASQSTEFEVNSKGFAKKHLYINPYTAESIGEIDTKDTFMRKVRKLHGELLLGTPGTLVVELVASWFLVLILTGIYVWWPQKNSGAAGFFTIRSNKSKRIFWRDVHAVSGFWASTLLLAVLAGAMPWTDVFGSNLKWVQAQTDTGYPKNWRNARGLESIQPVDHSISPLTIEHMVTIANEYKLPGQIKISLPTSNKGVYTIANTSLWLSDQQVIHIDQYSGHVVQAYKWSDVGILMDLRQVFMRFHQGEYGLVNWLLMLALGLTFIIMNIAGLTSYLKRKTKGDWSIPQVPSRFNVGAFLLVMILVLGIVFPLFGASLLLIFLWEKSRILLIANK